MHFSTRLSWAHTDSELSLLHQALAARGSLILDFSSSNPWRTGLSFSWLNQYPFSADSTEGIREDLSQVEDRQGIGKVSGSVNPVLDLPGTVEYQPDPKGLRLTRGAISESLMQKGAAVHPESLFLCASTSEAYGWVFKLLCEPGDVVLVPRPGYPLFEYLAGLECVRTVSYRLTYLHPQGWHIDFDSIERALTSPEANRIRAIVLINPNNPTGSYIQDSERKQLESLSEKYDIPLISDEVFLDFPVEPAQEPRSMAENAKVPTFILDGLSKQAGLPGYKLGWIALAGPSEWIQSASSRLELIADTYLSAGTPVMMAAPGILARRHHFLGFARQRIYENLKILRTILEYPGSPHRVLRCEGGWTALIHSPALESEESMSRRFLEEESLWVHPGYFFDMERECHAAPSLILPPEDTRQAAIRYRNCFDRLMNC